MAIIGTFTKTRDGYVGTIRTLTGSAKTRFVPNENRDNENAPLYRLFAGKAELGAAWPAKTEGEKPFEYLSVKLDDPSFPEPVYAALFDDEDDSARLVWTRPR